MTDPVSTSEERLSGEDAAGNGTAPATEGTAAREPQENAAPPGAASDAAAAGGLHESPEELAARVRELTTDLQRLQAEYVNYKRRVDRDRDLVLQNAKFSILSALLPVLDDVDRAREHEELTGGFRAVAESLERIVAGEGLVRFGAPGDPFDPRVHEALMHSLSPEVSTTTCDKVVQAGYSFGDRVVRPALVTVVDPQSGSAGDAVTSSPAAERAEEGADQASEPGPRAATEGTA